MSSDKSSNDCSGNWLLYASYSRRIPDLDKIQVADQQHVFFDPGDLEVSLRYGNPILPVHDHLLGAADEIALELAMLFLVRTQLLAKLRAPLRPLVLREQVEAVLMALRHDERIHPSRYACAASPGD